MRGLLPLLWIGCAAPPPVEAPERAPIEVSARLEAEPGAGEGRVRVQVVADEGLSWQVRPAPEGAVELTAQGSETEDLGDRVVTTFAYAWRAPAGSQVLGPFCVGAEAGPVCAPPIYVDVGTPRERPEMVDIVEAAALDAPLPWGRILAGAGLVGLALGGLWIAFRRRPPVRVEELPPEPPDQIALRRWEVVRGDEALTDPEKALALSQLFREYVEAVLAFPAMSWTTSETLDHLGALEHLPKENLPRAKRLLRATDLVKFAEKDPRGEFFDDLDSDLRAFVDSTRPRSWGGA